MNSDARVGLWGVYDKIRCVCYKVGVLSDGHPRAKQNRNVT